MKTGGLLNLTSVRGSSARRSHHLSASPPTTRAEIRAAAHGWSAPVANTWTGTARPGLVMIGCSGGRVRMWLHLPGPWSLNAVLDRE